MGCLTKQPILLFKIPIMLKVYKAFYIQSKAEIALIAAESAVQAIETLCNETHLDWEDLCDRVGFRKIDPFYWLVIRVNGECLTEVMKEVYNPKVLGFIKVSNG